MLAVSGLYASFEAISIDCIAIAPGHRKSDLRCVMGYDPSHNAAQRNIFSAPLHLIEREIALRLCGSLPDCIQREVRLKGLCGLWRVGAKGGPARTLSRVGRGNRACSYVCGCLIV